MHITFEMADSCLSLSLSFSLSSVKDACSAECFVLSFVARDNGFLSMKPAFVGKTNQLDPQKMWGSPPFSQEVNTHSLLTADKFGPILISPR